MHCSEEYENFTMKIDSGAKSSWPLPPSSVFKCRAAKPWISPELFHIETSQSYKQAGMMIEGCFEEVESQFIPQQPHSSFCSIEEESELVYSELVEIYGLPLPNSKIKSVEYSSNEEKGIDPGDTDAYMDTKIRRSKKPTDLHNPKHQNIVGLEVGDNIHSKKDKEYLGQKRKKWSPFSKDKSQSWRLFY